jgi:hypothetical protein
VGFCNRLHLNELGGGFILDFLCRFCYYRTL